MLAPVSCDIEEVLIQNKAEKEKRQGENKWSVVETGQCERETSGTVMRKFLQMGWELSFPPRGPVIKELCVRAALTLASTMQNQLLGEILSDLGERTCQSPCPSLTLGPDSLAHRESVE